MEESSHSYQRLVELMLQHGAQDDQEARAAAQNLLGFARLCLTVSKRQAADGDHQR